MPELLLCLDGLNILYHLALDLPIHQRSGWLAKRESPKAVELAREKWSLRSLNEIRIAYARISHESSGMLGNAA